MKTYLRFGWCQGKFVLMVTDENHKSPKIYHRISMTELEMSQVVDKFKYSQEDSEDCLANHEQLI